MKQKVANYSLILLLLFVVAFGLYQARQQNRSPFMSNATNYTVTQKSTILLNNTFGKNTVQMDLFRLKNEY